MTRRTGSARRATALALAGSLLFSGCGGQQQAERLDEQVTVTNCGKKASFPSPAKRLYVNDGNMISMVLALEAQQQVAGISSLGDDREVLSKAYGEDVVDALPVATPGYPNLENVIAQRPDTMVAGWSYGYGEADNLTPQILARHDIAAYVLTESCRQDSGARGTVPPWQALRTDLTNLGTITGRQAEASRVIDDIDRRLAELREAPQAEDPPTVFLFDSGSKNVFSSGSFGGPQAIIEAAGARNALADVSDTWVSVSWERIVAAEPDLIAFVDYPGQSFQEKVSLLRSNPSTRDLPAVQEGRFLNLPYASWTSGPLNIDAAEYLRKELEKEGLVPTSEITPELPDMVP